ncbi:hypothetical protein DPMN_059894 [Dreissena polymorpha]|uniref:Uncharacterized protein n=1 Tax=Dreissena polymorpha TaxID=45954 RepID=A0A9D4C485_DREPO|nr:hypothetical protein DPMN_059894 [Dreissena polymorpha]
MHFPCSYPSQLQELSTLRLSRPGLPGAGYALWVGYSLLHLITDASKEGWGAHLEPLSLIISGMWSHQESHLHINHYEMRAVFLAVSNF